MTDEKDYKPRPCIFRGGEREFTGDDDLCYLTENKCLLVFGPEYADECRAPDMIQFEVERRTKELSEQLDSAVLHVAKLCAEAGSATAETVWGESESKKRISALEAEVERLKLANDIMSGRDQLAEKIISEYEQEKAQGLMPGLSDAELQQILSWWEYCGDRNVKSLAIKIHDELIRRQGTITIFDGAE